MQHISVSSSNIRSIGYEANALEVAFHNGGVYQYANVPKSVYQSFMSAGSKGSFFQQNIKDVYPTSKVG